MEKVLKICLLHSIDTVCFGWHLTLGDQRLHALVCTVSCSLYEGNVHIIVPFPTFAKTRVDRSTEK